MCWKGKYLPGAKEEGFSLLELMACLPILILVGVAMLQLFSMGLRNYRQALGDWEMVQQVRIPMNSIAANIRYAKEIRLVRSGTNEYTLWVYRHFTYVEPDTQFDGWQQYNFSKLGTDSYWLKWNNQPMLGDTSLANVRFNECRCEILDGNRVRVVISAINKETGHTFRLDRCLRSYIISTAGTDQADGSSA